MDRSGYFCHWENKKNLEKKNSQKVIFIFFFKNFPRFSKSKLNILEIAFLYP